MQKGQTLIWVIAGALIIAGGVFYLGRSSNPKPSPTQIVTSQTPQSSPNAGPTEFKQETYNPPSGWKKFNSNLLKLSFYYPSEFKVTESGEGLSEVNLTKGISLSQANSPARWGIGEFSDYVGESRREWYLKKHPEISTDDKDNLKFTEFATVNTSGLLVTYTGNNYGWSDTLLIARGGNMLVVSANSGNEMNQQFFKSIKMDGNNSLQAKKPLVETAQNADWKTYTNSHGQYSLKYPMNWGPEKCPDGSKDTICSEVIAETASATEPLFYFIYFNEDNPPDTVPGIGKINYREETINNIQVLRTLDLPSRSGAETIFFKRDGNNYIQIGFTPYDKTIPWPEQNEHYAIFNKMLSTFKFN